MNKLSNIVDAEQEIGKWRQSLYELRLKNSRLKDLLSEAIQREVQLSFIEQAEDFQQKFIDKDQVIELLRRDLNYISARAHTGAYSEDDRQQLSVLDRDIRKFLHEFREMEHSFRTFLYPGA